MSASQIISFIRQVFADHGFDQAVIAVSGGIDSSLALTLLCLALGPEKIHALSLPDHQQSATTFNLICDFNHLPVANRQEIPIGKLVDGAARQLQISTDRSLTQDQIQRVRLGNLMARTRMLLTYDQAKKHQALVCGTENRSERLLGYFTRFGDSASDLEPLFWLFKSEVWQLARELNLPAQLIDQAPSAGLWTGQTDEQELGFSYGQAETVFQVLIKLGWLTKTDDLVWPTVANQLAESEIIAQIKNQLQADATAHNPSLQIEEEVLKRIIHRLWQAAFKRQVPYRPMA